MENVNGLVEFPLKLQREAIGDGTDVGCIGCLHSLFGSTKSHNHHSLYKFMQNRHFPIPGSALSPANAVNAGLGLNLRKVKGIGQHYQHSQYFREGMKSGESATYILLGTSNDSSQQKLNRSPKELVFHCTNADKKLYVCSIRLENRSEKCLAFQLKSNSPEEYVMKPTHGILAPKTKIEVRGLKNSEPLIPSTNKKMKDIFVVITLPIPASMTKDKPLTINSSIFERYEGRCCCEGVLYAGFSKHNPKIINESNVNGGVNSKALQRRLKLGQLWSIPEE